MPIKHVLLVDDDDALRRSLRRRLELFGCYVTEAANGDEALKSHDQAPADVLLTDIVMPGKEGVETIIEFRKKYPTVKIVAMSGGGIGYADDYLRIAGRLGASSLLQKPFSQDALIGAIG